jgi:hypothetical protein
MFAVIWFWLWILFALTAGLLVYRAVTLLSKGFRIKVIEKTGHHQIRMSAIFKGLHYWQEFGEWTVMKMTAANLDSVTTYEINQVVCQSLTPK